MSPALHNLGNCYANGLGVPQSDHNALLYYEAAREVGDPAAMFTLANWTFTGRSCEKNIELAHQQHLKAAELGHPGSMYNAGCNYMQGQGVAVDAVEAKKWFERAAQTGFEMAVVNLASMHRDGLGTPRDLGKAKEILEPHAGHSEICRAALEDVEEEIRAETPLLLRRP